MGRDESHRRERLSGRGRAGPATGRAGQGGGGEGEFTIGLKNWRQLTNNNGRVCSGPLDMGMAEALGENVDILLATELGTTGRTGRPDCGAYVLEYETRPKAQPGSAVGAFFGTSSQNKWARIEGMGEPKNSRMYLVEQGSRFILTGVFYAHQTQDIATNGA